MKKLTRNQLKSIKGGTCTCAYCYYYNGTGDCTCGSGTCHPRKEIEPQD